MRAEDFVEMVRLQRVLADALVEEYPQYGTNKLLLGVPSPVTLEVDGRTWVASKHGVGVAFARTRPPPSLVIDMHSSVSDTERIDAWRVQQFLESMGQYLDYDEVQAVIKSAVDNGILIQRPDGAFKLTK